MPFIQSAGAEVLQNDIRAPRQLAKDFLPTRQMKIQGDRFLVAVDAQKRRAGILGRCVRHARSKQATDITSHGQLTLDDFRAQIGQLRRGHRPGVRVVL